MSKNEIWVQIKQDSVKTHLKSSRKNRSKLMYINLIPQTIFPKGVIATALALRLPTTQALYRDNIRMK